MIALPTRITSALLYIQLWVQLPSQTRFVSLRGIPASQSLGIGLLVKMKWVLLRAMSLLFEALPPLESKFATAVWRECAEANASSRSYDYIFDYTFMLDSSLEIRVSASGYVQGGFYDGNSDRQNHGQRIQQSTMGGLHDHVINVSD
jgi:hypothetical protein